MVTNKWPHFHVSVQFQQQLVRHYYVTFLTRLVAIVTNIPMLLISTYYTHGAEFASIFMCLWLHIYAENIFLTGWETPSPKILIAILLSDHRILRSSKMHISHCSSAACLQMIVVEDVTSDDCPITHECCSKLPLWAKLLLQTMHSNLFCPVWILKCWVK